MTTNNVQEPFDIAKILSFLPHRYPMLMVDRVVELVRGERIKALKNVTINEPFFQGHYPGQPIMPGVMIIEALAQAAGLLSLDYLPPERRGQAVYFMSIDKVKFRKMVVPGDQLVLEAEVLQWRPKVNPKIVKVGAKASVNGVLATEAELMAAFADFAD